MGRDKGFDERSNEPTDTRVILDRVSRWCADNGVRDAHIQTWHSHGVHGLTIVTPPIVNDDHSAPPRLDDIHRDQLIELLRTHHGNISKLADTLRTFRVQLRRLLRRLDLDPDLYRLAATGRQRTSDDITITTERRPRKDLTLH